MQQHQPYPDQDAGEIKLHLLDYWRVIRVRLPLIILVFLLVVITAGVATYLTPRQYMSSVTMQVKEDNNNMQIFNGQNGPRYDPRFSTTQFQIIQRKEILYPVIDAMKLMHRWDLRSRDVAYMRLRSMLTVTEVRNTDLIQISVLDKDRQEAADLANTIALEYQKKRIDEQQSWVARSLVQLEDEVQKQRRKVEELRDQMTKIRIEGKIYDLNPESVEDPRQAEETILQNVESQVNDSRIKVATLRSKQQQIQEMTDEQIMRSLKTFEMDDATISQILPQYEACVSEEAHMLNSGLGPNHPNVQSLQAKKKVYARQLADQIAILRKSLSANLEIAEKSLEAMEQKLGDARQHQMEAKSKALHYQEAKNEYLKAKRILESAESRYSTEAMQRTMPQSPATIWEKAEVSDFPAKPRVTQNMMIAVAVGLALGIGLAFLIEYLDTSVKTMQDIEAALGVPVLAVIPRDVAILKDAPRLPRRRGVPYHEDEHRVQQEVARCQHADRRQRRGWGGQIDDAQQPRLHLREGRLSHADRGCRFAPSLPAPFLRGFQREGPYRLPHKRHPAGSLADPDRGGESYPAAQRQTAHRRGRDPQFPEDDRSDPACQGRLRHGFLRLAADPRGQRRLGDREFGRPHSRCGAAPPLSAGDAPAGEAGSRQRRSQHRGMRAQ